MAEPLASLRAVDEADVWKGDAFAGRLRREGDDVVWYPDPEAGDPAPDVAVSLGRDAGAVRATGGSVPPFFAGLLPEGARLGAVVTAARTSEDDHLTLLLAVGQDTVGDVRVVPSGTVPVDPPVLLDEDDTAALDLQAMFDRSVDPAAVEAERRALPGVQPKVSASAVSSPVTTARGPAILKLTPPALPRLCENEHFFLGLAARAVSPCRSTACCGTTAVGRGCWSVGSTGSSMRRDRCAAWRRRTRASCSSSWRSATSSATATCTARTCPSAGCRRRGRRSRPSTTSSRRSRTCRSGIRWRWTCTAARTGSTGDICSRPLFIWGCQNALSLARSLDRIVAATEPWIERVPEIGLEDRASGRLQDLLRRRSSELAGSTRRG